MMNRIVICLMFFCTLTLGGCTFQNNVRDVSADNTFIDESNENEINQKDKIPPTSEIKISAVGDIMVHGPQLKAQYDQKSKSYDFKNNFQFVKPYIAQADIALCNLETTFGGEDKGYSSFPMFNSPDTLGEAIKNTGFDVVITANNHSIDSSDKGVYRTIQTLKNLGLDIVGTKENENYDNFIIKEIKGIKIGIIAYTYETPLCGKNKTLNSLTIPKGLENCINTFNYDHIEKDLEKMKNEIKHMKQQGAEIIIFYLHWGNEYERQPNKHQKNIAQSLAEYGVNIILGSHPHVLQPVEFIQSNNGKNKTFVAYSMGNFLSNQRYEIMKNRYTEDGIILNITVKKDFKNNEILLSEISYIPTWVHKYSTNNKRMYEILPLPDALNNHITYHLVDQDSLWRAENSMNNTGILIQSNTNENIKLTPSLLNSAH